MKLLTTAAAEAAEAAFSILERIELGETLLKALDAAEYDAPFSILERIELGETTSKRAIQVAPSRSFSILERIELGETPGGGTLQPLDESLSVSSNGSNWVKLWSLKPEYTRILLSVSSNGSNWVKRISQAPVTAPSETFSILERIELGETMEVQGEENSGRALSVSSNGSNWVKLM